MNEPPQTKSDFLRCIAIETARMSYPGSMGRGKKKVVRKDTKKAIERYFANRFPISQVWNNASQLAHRYDRWHAQRTAELANVISRYKGASENNSKTIAAKFINTFMHQLMKYKPCRPLLKYLHLPLDRRVFQALRSRSLFYAGKEDILPILRKPPYSVNYKEYMQVQNALWGVVNALNREHRHRVRFKSRLDLNWMWL